MKVLIEIDEEEYKTLSSLSDREKVNDLMGYEKIIANGVPLNGTNGEVLQAMFPNASVCEHGSTYSVNNVFNFNSTWWNAEYKAESKE